jgi:iduronate 2-sulfatase
MACLAIVTVACFYAASVSAESPNVLLISVDDLRPQFGRSFGTPEVKTPNLDKFFLDGGGSAMQHAYVQIAVCGPSRTSMLTGRRPDTTHVGVGPGPGGGLLAGWCWCQRTSCKKDDLFMTLPTYMRQHGYTTAGNGKLFHPQACGGMTPFRNYGFTHAEGDDPRAWTEQYYAEANNTQTQFGSIPGPLDPVFNHTMGLSFMESPLSDEEETDGMLATNAVERFANFSRDGIGKKGANKPFFHSVGFHKPHLPHIVPKKYFDMYKLEDVSLPPNRNCPVGFKEENWHNNGNVEMESYNLNAGPEFKKEGFSFSHPIGDNFTRAMRRGYFAAVSFIDAQIGRVLNALEQYEYKDNTIVVLWGDHGWHLGDTNSWSKLTNFESAARTTMMWHIPGQSAASQGLNKRLVEIVDIFPTLIDLTGLPKLPKCEGVDQPPSVACLQGESYASEFGMHGIAPTVAKKYAFTQWPYPKWGKNVTGFRMGYTVRSSDGYRYTEYVPYDPLTFHGRWTAESGDPELYNYNDDYWETRNWALNASYANVVTELKAVLRKQYSPDFVYVV